MNNFQHLYLFHVFSFVEQSVIPNVIQINKKCALVCLNAAHRISYDHHLVHLPTTTSTLRSLHVLPSQHNGDIANDTFTPFNYKPLQHLRSCNTLRSLTFSDNATVSFHLFTNVINNIQPHILTQIEFGMFDHSAEMIKSFVDILSHTQTNLRRLRFWKDPGEEERDSQPDEIQSFSNLQYLESFRCFVWSSTLVNLVHLTHLNIYFHTYTFNDVVSDFQRFPNLRSLHLRSTIFKTFSSISEITKLTQIQTLDLSGTQINKDTQIFTLSNCSNFTKITIYYIHQISENLFNLMRYVPQFHIQLQLYTAPLDDQSFPPLNSDGSCFDPHYLQILHTTFVQRKWKNKLLITLFKRYDSFNCSNILKCSGISNTLQRLELHFIGKLHNLSIINNLTLLTALTLRHCSIDQNDIINLNGLHSLQRLSIVDCFQYFLISVQSLPSLTFVSLKTQFSATALITQLHSLKRLKQVCLHHIQCVTKEDLLELMGLDQVEHFFI
ncbi:F-box domain containing protein [Entamoeba marina]